MTKRRFYCDAETFSDQDVTKVGAYRHTGSPVFNDLVWAWGWEDEPIVGGIFEDDAELPEAVQHALREAEAGRAVIVAHNAAFERLVMSVVEYEENIYGEKDFLPPEWFDDTAARAAIWGFPRSLDKIAPALGLPIEKDTEGKRLISKFSKPNRKGERNRLADHPEDAKKFVDYCVTDTEVLRAVDRKLPAWPPGEYETWLLDQHINDRGIPLDLELAAAAHRAVRANFVADEIEVMHLTGVANPNSPQQMSAWLRGQPGLEKVKSMDKDHVAAMLERDDLSDTVRAVLGLRQRMAGTATKKFGAMLAVADPDHRARGQLLYAGAHTGRWAGRGFQPQNLPRVGFSEKADKEFDEETQERLRAKREAEAILQVMRGHDTDPDTLKKLVRPCLLGPITGVDFSSIEARVIAWLAEEEWALEAFRADRDIYVETANRMSDSTGQEFDRQDGKVTTLALGFAGSIGALRNMGAVGTDEELYQLVYAWRDANPRIGDLWTSLKMNLPRGGITIGNGAVRALGKPDERKLFLILPSGRALSYRKLSIRSFDKIHPKTGEPYVERSWGFVGSKGMWEKTWHGTLCENIVQAIARDVLVHAMKNLEAEGYRTLGTVHDEVLIEGAHDVDEVIEIMCQLPSWAEGLPMGADGAVMERYRK